LEACLSPELDARAGLGCQWSTLVLLSSIQHPAFQTLLSSRVLTCRSGQLRGCNRTHRPGEAEDVYFSLSGGWKSKTRVSAHPASGVGSPRLMDGGSSCVLTWKGESSEVCSHKGTNVITGPTSQIPPPAPQHRPTAGESFSAWVSGTQNIFV